MNHAMPPSSNETEALPDAASPSHPLFAAPRMSGAAAVPDRRRRRAVGRLAAAGLLAAVGAPAIGQSRAKVKLGYWPISGGLAFFTAVERGYFAEAGIDIEPVRFAGPNQVVEAMIAGRIDGSANGTSSPTLALGDAQAPGSIQYFCVNFANASYVIDHIVVPKDSPLSSVKELGGKRYACGPGINNVTLAKAVLEGAGIASPKVIELPATQLLPAIASGQVDAAYVLEPTAVIGRKQGISRILETAVISRYVLGDAQTPWFGGAASLNTRFIESDPALARKVVDAYARGVAHVREVGAAANAYLKGYTAIEGDLIAEVPVSGYRMASEMQASDWAAMQKLFDLFHDKKVVPQPLFAERMKLKL